MKIGHYRDLTLIHLNNKEILVIACDSCGAVGEKPCDKLNVPADIAGALTARVVLTEVMCSGAEIICIQDSLSCEMYPTGKKIIEGIKAELLKAKLDVQLLSGSTEDNFETSMTGIGVVAQGISSKPLRFGGVSKGDYAVLAGMPKCGSSVQIPFDDDFITYEEIQTFLQNPHIGEIVPCGSKGVGHEAQQIALCNNLSFKPYDESEKLLWASAGPASCIVVTISPKNYSSLQNMNTKFRIMGIFE